MNYKNVQKRLFIEGGIIAVILAILGAAIYGLDILSDDYAKEKATLDGEVASVTSEMESLKAKTDKFHENIDLYKTVTKKEAEGDLTISRVVLRNKFDEFKQKYFLGDLHTTMANLQVPPGTQYRRNGQEIVSSQISLSFNALTDEDVYQLVQDLPQILPGVIKITHLAVSRVGKVNDQALREIADKGQYAMVKVDLAFTWFGLRSVETPAAMQAHAPAHP